MDLISERRTAIDRISNLPTNLITRILSLLSTKDAVKTSALSTHWIRQWTLTAKLDVDDGLIFNKNPIPANATNIVRFLYRVLLFKVTPLDLFRLRCGRDYGVTNVIQWITASLNRNVREIDISVPLYGRLFEHDYLFSCRTLVVLSLGMGLNLTVPEIISLESLKTLKICEVKFEDGESLSRLISSCPVLERLKITERLSGTVDVLNISSPSLQYLELNELSYEMFDENVVIYAYEVVLNTPSLVYLKHIDKGGPHVYRVESTLNCLLGAFLFFSSVFDDKGDEVVLECSFPDLAGAMSNTRILVLSGLAFQGLCRPDCELPNYPHLTNLDIGPIRTNAGLSLLTAFLQSSPQLASLDFALEYDFEFWVPPTDVPSCMLYNLKVIKVCYACKSEALLSIVKYFLAKTDCLKKLILHRIKERNEQFIKEVSLLPRASNSCEIVFS